MAVYYHFILIYSSELIFNHEIFKVWSSIMNRSEKNLRKLVNENVAHFMEKAKGREVIITLCARLVDRNTGQ